MCQRVRRCFEAGALATGASAEIRVGDKPYAQMRHASALADVYQRNAEALGRRFPALPERFRQPTVSTDMGNVSLAIPSIHPMIGIESLPYVNHQPGFADRCVTAPADKAVLDGATAMAWTAIDLAADEAIRVALVASPSPA